MSFVTISVKKSDRDALKEAAELFNKHRNPKLGKISIAGIVSAVADTLAKQMKEDNLMSGDNEPVFILGNTFTKQLYEQQLEVSPSQATANLTKALVAGRV